MNRYLLSNFRQKILPIIPSSKRIFKPVPDTFEFDPDKFEFGARYSYCNNDTSYRGFILKEIKGLFKAFYGTEKWQEVVITFETSKYGHNNWPNTVNFLFDKELQFSQYGIEFIYNGKSYATIGISEMLKEIPLSELYKVMKDIGKTGFKNRILNRHCSLTSEDYQTAKEIFKNGDAEFLYLFGKDRIPVPNSKELYELISDEHFRSKKKQAMSGTSVFYGNVAAVFNYYYPLFDEKISQYFMEMIANRNNDRNYSFSSAESFGNIIGRFKKMIKKDEKTKEKLPEPLKLLIEMDNFV